MQCQKIFLTLILVVVVGKGCCNVINDEYGHDVIGGPMEPGWLWNSDYPNPKTDFTKCQQSKPSTICDPDNLLSTSESSRLNDLIQRLSNTSPCLCKDDCIENAHSKGLIVGVALMKAFYHAQHKDKILVAKNMSQAIMKKWNFGTCKNDILILISEDNLVANIETGDAVKEFIPEETIEEIFQQCKEYFNGKAYYSGLESIINSLYDSIQSKLLKAPAGKEEADSKTGNIGLTVGLVVGIACLAGFAVVGFLVIRRRQRRGSNQNGFMYDGSGRQGNRNMKRDMISPIVKSPVVFPDAVYQPCSVDEKKAAITKHRAGSDDEDDVDNNEDQYLRRLEENPAYMSADLTRELSVVEEGSEPEAKTPPGVTGPYRSNIASSNEDKMNHTASA